MEPAIGVQLARFMLCAGHTVGKRRGVAAVEQWQHRSSDGVIK